MLAIPTPVSDAINLADWLEVRALIVDDGSASSADMRRALVSMGVTGEEDVATVRLVDAEEVMAAEAFAEIEDRIRACPDGYPFFVDGAQLKRRGDLDRYWAYNFCLLLAVQGANRGEAPVRSAELFEEVSEIAARKYISGQSVKFGFPRRVLPGGFMDALEKVCVQVGEGDKPKTRPGSADVKDARLDIVAWRPFPDRRRAQLILFGQCAAGGNWDDKLTDLQPRAFTDLYWMDPPAADIVKGFFTPFRVSHNDWWLFGDSCG
jgi:hypothetical protein